MQWMYHQAIQTAKFDGCVLGIVGILCGSNHLLFGCYFENVMAMILGWFLGRYFWDRHLLAFLVLRPIPWFENVSDTPHSGIELDWIVKISQVSSMVESQINKINWNE